MTARDIAAVIGPPGCGKTTVGGALACNMIITRLADRVLLTAYTNSATDEFGRELCYLLGDKIASQINAKGLQKETRYVSLFYFVNTSSKSL